MVKTGQWAGWALFAGAVLFWSSSWALAAEVTPAPEAKPAAEAAAAAEAALPAEAAPAGGESKLQQLEDRVAALEQEKKKAEAAKKPASWADHITIGGDLRLRFEAIDKPGWAPPVADRDRERLRLRLTLDDKLSDDLDVHVRLATGEAKDISRGADPVSTNVTLTNSDTKKSMWLDIADVDYHPGYIPGLHLIAGKMPVPFYVPGGSDLVWDGDLTPEGAALKYAPTFGPIQFLANLAGFAVMERAAASDSSLLGAQGAVKGTFLNKQAYLLVGAGGYGYGSTQGRPVFDWQGANMSYGNTKTKADTYLYDYNEVEYFFETGYDLHAGALVVPLAFFGNMVENTAQDVQDNKGYLIGFNVGKLDKPGSLAFHYDFRLLEKDAVVGAFTDSDSWGGGTNGRGHKLSLQAQIMKNVTAGITYFMDEANISSTDKVNRNGDYNRVQADVVLKL
jgi:hypothetical protein